MAILHRPSQRIAFWVSRFPSNRVRIFLYRVLFGYEISREATIGRGTILACNQVKIGKAKLGRENLIYGPMCFSLGDGARIGNHNTIECGAWVLDSSFQREEYRRECRLGTGILITDHHYIDAVGGFFLEENAWIAGRGSQIWTHGRGPGEVRIGKGTYVGSASRFSPGASIGENCVVGLGSVITKQWTEANVLIAGVPARVIKTIEADANVDSQVD